jgi:membrane-bound lytic murein transglycosylase A
MKPRTIVTIGLILISLGVFAWWWSTQRHGGGEVRELKPATYADIRGWKNADLAPALSAFRRSCAGMAASHYGEFEVSCALASAPIRDPRAFFETNFVPYAIGEGLVTGYYEPLLYASRFPHGRYRTPIYARPADLISVDLGVFRPELAGQKIAGRIKDRNLIPYPTRAQIDADPPAAAPVLMYADDPVAVFFLHIQGSGRVKLDDGRVLRLIYDGQNGQPYTPVGHILVDRYGLSRDGMSMQAIRNWLKANPAHMREVLESDASFVFFREAPVADATLGPPGSEGVPLTPEGSIAVDPRFTAFGMPVFLSGDGLTRLAIAQDTGGAIKGQARADLFYGFGPKAELAAGGLKAHPDFFVLMPKDAAVSQ